MVLPPDSWIGISTRHRITGEVATNSRVVGGKIRAHVDLCRCIGNPLAINLTSTAKYFVIVWIGLPSQFRRLDFLRKSNQSKGLAPLPNEIDVVWQGLAEYEATKTQAGTRNFFRFRPGFPQLGKWRDGRPRPSRWMFSLCSPARRLLSLSAPSEALRRQC